MSLRVVALGTGVCANHYLPGEDRQPPGFLVDANGTLILLDCSEGMRFRLAKAGYEYGRVGHVAVTHGHPDHAALPQFLQARVCRRLFGADDCVAFGECRVYLPHLLAEKFPQVWDWHQPELEGSYWPQFMPEFVGVGDGTIVKISDDITLKVFSVFHGFGKHPAVAYRIETPDGIVTYSGDAGSCDGLVAAAKGADLFICEQSFQIGYKDTAKYGHLTPFEAGEIAVRAGVKRLRLTHYVGLDTDAAAIAEVRRGGFTGDVERAKDGDAWDV